MICFQHERNIIVQAEFNSSNYAKIIRIYDVMSFFQTVRAAQEIILLHGRGRRLNKVDKLARFACESDFTEDYEFLSMRFVSSNCQGASPGGVTITWKN